MKSLIFVLILASIIPLIFYFTRMSKFKSNVATLTKYSDEAVEELKRIGVDQEYRRKGNDELLRIYKEILDSYDPKMTALRTSVDIGVRAKFIEDILTERNIEIPQVE